MPRDPDRRQRLLDLLDQIWKLDPDLRLGQILQWEADKVGKDLFYVEDDEMEDRLKARLKIEQDVRMRREARNQ